MQLFAGIPSTFKTYNGELNYQINIANNSNNTRQVSENYLGATSAHTFIQVFQEVSSVGLWNPVSSIVFTSNTLPIVSTETSAPQVYNSQSDGMTSSGAPNIANILTDFEIPISSTNQYRPEISYTPAGEYRWVDLNNSFILTKLDLHVFWRDRWGNLNPFLLQIQKLLFGI